MMNQEITKMTFTMPLYLHEEISCRAKSAKRRKAAELIVRLQESLLAYSSVPMGLKETEHLKLLLQSKDFSKRVAITVPTDLHRQLKSASIHAGQSLGLELSCRIQQSMREDSHHYMKLARS